MRRATDPWESHRDGMINTVVPEVKVPSHQGPDAQTAIPNLDVPTIAAAGPFNLSHIHFTMVETTPPVAGHHPGIVRFTRGANWCALHKNKALRSAEAVGGRHDVCP